MVQPAEIFEAARTIRSELPTLLGEQAPAVDQALAELLAQAKAGQDTSQAVLALLKQQGAAYQWMAEFISLKRNSKGGYEALPGMSAIAARKYCCPEGDYVWYRRSVGTPVPICPTHGELVPADASPDPS